MIPIISKDINYPRICILQDEMKLFKIISIKYEKIYIAILTLSIVPEALHVKKMQL